MSMRYACLSALSRHSEPTELNPQKTTLRNLRSSIKAIRQQLKLSLDNMKNQLTKVNEIDEMHDPDHDMIGRMAALGEVVLQTLHQHRRSSSH